MNLLMFDIDIYLFWLMKCGVDSSSNAFAVDPLDEHRSPGSARYLRRFSVCFFHLPSHREPRPLWHR